MAGFYFEVIKVTDKLGRVSVIELTKGFNVVCGPSSTGKTLIFNTIDYLLDADDLYGEESEDYLFVEALINYNGNRIWVKRDVSPSRSYALRNDSESEYEKITAKQYRDILLSMTGIPPKINIYRTQSRDEQSLTFRSMLQLMLIDEERISTSHPILMASKGGLFNYTPCLSVILYLLYGIDAKFFSDQETEREKKIKKEVLRNYIDQKLVALSKQISLLDESLGDCASPDYSVSIEKVANMISNLEKESVVVSNRIRDYTANRCSLERELTELNVVLDRYRVLMGQYDSDLLRLRFLEDGNKTISKIPHSSICPFCNGPLHEEQEDQYLAVAITEKNQISMLKTDLIKAIESVESTIDQKKEKIQEINCDVSNLQEKLNKEIVPELNSLQKQIQSHERRLQILSEKESLNKIKVELEKDVSDVEVTSSEKREFVPRDYFEDDFFRDISKTIESILIELGYKNYLTSIFDKDDFDVIVNGKRKRNEGQGYRSLLNTVVEIAMRSYMLSHGKTYPGFLVFDSPTMALMEVPNPDDYNSMKSRLYEYISRNQNNIGQIVFIENEIPIFCHGETNIIEFTKSNEYGRYGFLQGVED